jgi:hypothetical protein
LSLDLQYDPREKKKNSVALSKFSNPELSAEKIRRVIEEQKKSEVAEKKKLIGELEKK